MRDRVRVGVIANAADDLSDAKREERLRREVADLKGIGLKPSEIDLRQYFGHGSGLLSELGSVNALWVLGGNVLALRTALSASGADAAIERRLSEDSIVYAGYSAGACVLGPREALSVATLSGNLPGYPPELVSTGIGLLPYAVVPHCDDEPDAVGVTGLARHYIEIHVPFIALRDGQAIVVDGDDTRVVE
jgi:dipeptidase E